MNKNRINQTIFTAFVTACAFATSSAYAIEDFVTALERTQTAADVQTDGSFSETAKSAQTDSQGKLLSADDLEQLRQSTKVTTGGETDTTFGTLASSGVCHKDGHIGCAVIPSAEEIDDTFLSMTASTTSLYTCGHMTAEPVSGVKTCKGFSRTGVTSTHTLGEDISTEGISGIAAPSSKTTPVSVK